MQLPYLPGFIIEWVGVVVGLLLLIYIYFFCLFFPHLELQFPFNTIRFTPARKILARTCFMKRTHGSFVRWRSVVCTYDHGA